MRAKLMLGLLAAPLLMTALAGCTVHIGCRPTHEEGSRVFASDPQGTDRGAESGANATHRFVVQVTSETPDGEPLLGVPVVFFRTVTRTVERECAGDRTVTDARTEHVALPALRTNTAGIVEVRVEPQGSVGIVVGPGAGHLGAERARVAVGAAREATHLMIPLLRATLPLHVTGAWTTSAPAAPHAPAWQAHPLVFHAHPEVQRAYEQRMVGLEAVLRWDNGPLASADLFVGFGAGDGRPDVRGRNEQVQTPVDRDNRERLSLDEGQLDALRPAFSASKPPSLAALTTAPVVALQPLEYRLEATVHFHESLEFRIA
jgi:hypothetical protein